MIRKKIHWTVIIVGLIVLFGFCILLFFKNKSATPARTPPSVTKHTIPIQGGTLHYQATVGLMPIDAVSSNQPLKASMSYMAYTKLGETNRPITFIWCGGPGQSSLSENFYLSGPKIFNSNTGALENNLQTWLRYTDLVYIDMVGSGWGRPASDEAAKIIYSPEGDAATFTVFIENYLRQSNREASKIYLVGESYGGLRATLVAQHLLKDTIAIQGMILFSPELNDYYNHPAVFGSDMPYILSLPTFLRAALYHHKLKPDFQNNPEKTIEEGVAWALTQYPALLLKGDDLSPSDRAQLETNLENYTGLSAPLLRNNHYRLSTSVFYKQLLNNDHQTIDYLDTRRGDYVLTSDEGLFVLNIESLMKSQLSMYPVAMNYIKNTLKYSYPGHYVNYFYPKYWKYNPKYKQVLSVLHDDMIINEHMKLLVGLGYYDADIPYMVNKVAIHQLLLPESIRKNITLHVYQGGHMFYLNNPNILLQLNNDVEQFYS